VQGNPEIMKSKWTTEEDQQLTQLVAQYKNCWAHISRQMPGRTDQQCMVLPPPPPPTPPPPRPTHGATFRTEDLETTPGLPMYHLQVA